MSDDIEEGEIVDEDVENFLREYSLEEPSQDNDLCYNDVAYDPSDYLRTDVFSSTFISPEDLIGVDYHSPSDNDSVQINHGNDTFETEELELRELALGSLNKNLTSQATANSKLDDNSRRKPPRHRRRQRRYRFEKRRRRCQQAILNVHRDESKLSKVLREGSHDEQVQNFLKFINDNPLVKDPVLVTIPDVISQPVLVTNSDVVAQPVVVTKPDLVSQSGVVTKPDLVSMSGVVTNSDVVAQQVVVIKPNATTESVGFTIVSDNYDLIPMDMSDSDNEVKKNDLQSDNLVEYSNQMLNCEPDWIIIDEISSPIASDRLDSEVITMGDSSNDKNNPQKLNCPDKEDEPLEKFTDDEDLEEEILRQQALASMFHKKPKSDSKYSKKTTVSTNIRCRPLRPVAKIHTTSVKPLIVNEKFSCRNDSVKRGPRKSRPSALSPNQTINLSDKDSYIQYHQLLPSNVTSKSKQQIQRDKHLTAQDKTQIKPQSPCLDIVWSPAKCISSKSQKSIIDSPKQKRLDITSGSIENKNQFSHAKLDRAIKPQNQKPKDLMSAKKSNIVKSTTPVLPKVTEIIKSPRLTTSKHTTVTTGTVSKINPADIAQFNVSNLHKKPDSTMKFIHSKTTQPKRRFIIQLGNSSSEDEDTEITTKTDIAPQPISQGTPLESTISSFLQSCRKDAEHLENSLELMSNVIPIQPPPQAFIISNPNGATCSDSEFSHVVTQTSSINTTELQLSQSLVVPKKIVDTPLSTDKSICINSNNSSEAFKIECQPSSAIRTVIPPRRKSTVSNPATLALINKAILQRKQTFLQSELHVIKKKEVIAIKKELRDTRQKEIFNLRSKLTTLVGDQKRLNIDIHKEEKSLIPLESARVQNGKLYTSFVEIAKKSLKVPLNSKVLSPTSSVNSLVTLKKQPIRSYSLVTLLERASTSCRRHCYFRTVVPEPLLNLQGRSRCNGPTDNLALCMDTDYRIKSGDTNFGTYELNVSLALPQQEASVALFNNSTSEFPKLIPVSNIEVASNVSIDLHTGITNFSADIPQSFSCSLAEKGLPLILSASPESPPTVETDIIKSEKIYIASEQVSLPSSKSKSSFQSKPLQSQPCIIQPEHIKTFERKQGSIYVKSELPCLNQVKVTQPNDLLPVNTNLYKRHHQQNLSFSEPASKKLKRAIKTENLFDINEIVCPFILDGECRDKSCEFQHPSCFMSLPSKQASNIDPSSEKLSSVALQNQVYEGKSSSLTEYKKVVGLISHLSCDICSIRVSISTTHLINDITCESCLTIARSNPGEIKHILSLLHHLHFRIVRKQNRNEPTADMIHTLISVADEFMNSHHKHSVLLVKHLIQAINMKTVLSTDISSVPNVEHILKTIDFSVPICLYAAENTESYAKKRAILLKCIQINLARPNVPKKTELLLIYCRLESMAGFSQRCRSFLLGLIKKYKPLEGLSTSEICFFTRILLDWIVLGYLPHVWPVYTRYQKTENLLKEQEIVMTLLKSALFQIIDFDSHKLVQERFVYETNVAYIIHVYIDLLVASKHLKFAFELCCSLCCMVDWTDSFFADLTYLLHRSGTAEKSIDLDFLKSLLQSKDQADIFYPQSIVLSVNWFCRNRKFEHCLKLLSNLAFWLYTDAAHSAQPLNLYRHFLGIGNFLLAQRYWKPRFKHSDLLRNGSLLYIWLGYALLSCLLGEQEEVVESLEQLCLPNMITARDKHFALYFLLDLALTTALPKNHLHYYRFVKRVSTFELPWLSLHHANDDITLVYLSEVIQRIKFDELLLDQRSEICHRLLDLKPENVVLLTSLVKSVLALDSAEDQRLAYSLCQSFAFHAPTVEDFWLLYLCLARLVVCPSEVIRDLLTKAVGCLPSSRQLWIEFRVFALEVKKTRLLLSVEQRMDRSGLFPGKKYT